MSQEVVQLIREEAYPEALSILVKLIDADPDDWSNNYLMGQCYRSMGNIDEAVTYLDKAAIIKPEDSPTWMALGIAHQQDQNWKAAIGSLKMALEIDPDFVLAYNSLAYTQLEMGEVENAVHNYDAGLKALARQVVSTFENARNNPILAFEPTETELWIEYAMYAALFISAANEDLDSIAWPNGEMAEREERTHEHEGLFWDDRKSANGDQMRLFLPNYFETFKAALMDDQSYSTLIWNRGDALKNFGNLEDAAVHFKEAEDFSA